MNQIFKFRTSVAVVFLVWADSNFWTKSFQPVMRRPIRTLAIALFSLYSVELSYYRPCHTLFVVGNTWLVVFTDTLFNYVRLWQWDVVNIDVLCCVAYHPILESRHVCKIDNTNSYQHNQTGLISAAHFVSPGLCSELCQDEDWWIFSSWALYLGGLTLKLAAYMY